MKIMDVCYAFYMYKYFFAELYVQVLNNSERQEIPYILVIGSSYIVESNVTCLNARVRFKCLENIPTPLLVCFVPSETPEVKEWLDRLRPQNVPRCSNSHVLKDCLILNEKQINNIVPYNVKDGSATPFQHERSNFLQPILSVWTDRSYNKSMQAAL